MNLNSFQNFCRDIPAVAEKGLMDELFDKLEKALKAKWLVTYATEAAQYAHMGIIAINLCQNPKEDGYYAQAKKLIQKIVNPVIATLNAISTALLLLYMMKQAWDAIPTWEELRMIFEAELKKVAAVVIKGAIAEAIQAAVCGSKFQKVAIPELSGMISDQLITITILTALKTSYESYEEHQKRS